MEIRIGLPIGRRLRNIGAVAFNRPARQIAQLESAVGFDCALIVYINDRLAACIYFVFGIFRSIDDISVDRLRAIRAVDHRIDLKILRGIRLQFFAVGREVFHRHRRINRLYGIDIIFLQPGFFLLRRSNRGRIFNGLLRHIGRRTRIVVLCGEHIRSFPFRRGISDIADSDKIARKIFFP